MFVAMMTVPGRSERIEDAIRLYEGTVLPILRQQPGFHSLLVLTSEESSEWCSLGFWDTAEHARAFEQTAAFRELAVTFLPLLAGLPVRELYRARVWSRTGS